MACSCILTGIRHAGHAIANGMRAVGGFVRRVFNSSARMRTFELNPPADQHVNDGAVINAIRGAEGNYNDGFDSGDVDPNVDGAAADRNSGLHRPIYFDGDDNSAGYITNRNGQPIVVLNDTSLAGLLRLTGKLEEILSGAPINANLINELNLILNAIREAPAFTENQILADNVQNVAARVAITQAQQQ